MSAKSEWLEVLHDTRVANPHLTYRRQLKLAQHAYRSSLAEKANNALEVGAQLSESALRRTRTEGKKFVKSAARASTDAASFMAKKVGDAVSATKSATANLALEKTNQYLRSVGADQPVHCPNPLCTYGPGKEKTNRLNFTTVTGSRLTVCLACKVVVGAY